MAESTTPSTPTKKPASRAKNANRTHAKKSAPKHTGGAAANTGGNAALNGQQDDWRALNRVVSRYMAGHPNASIGETTIGELLAYAETKRPKTMAAGA